MAHGGVREGGEREREKRREEPCTLRRPFIEAKQSNQFTNRRLQTELLGWRARLRRGSAARAGFTPIHIKGFQGRGKEL